MSTLNTLHINIKYDLLECAGVVDVVLDAQVDDEGRDGQAVLTRVFPPGGRHLV